MNKPFLGYFYPKVQTKNCNRVSKFQNLISKKKSNPPRLTLKSRNILIVNIVYNNQKNNILQNEAM